MSGLSALISAHFRNSYRLKPFVLATMLGLAVFFIVGFVALVCALAIVPETRSANPDAAKIARYLAMLVYGSGFIAMGLNVNIFTANSLVKEKAQRIHESILGAPVGVRKLWMAKSLAVFLPGLALCELFSIATFVGVEALVIAPRMGFVVSAATLLSGLALVPIAYFPICCIVILVGLAGNPVSGNVIANVAFSTLIALTMNLATRAGLDLGSPAFALANLAFAALLGLVVLALLPRLTKERVILSCKN